MVSLLAGNATSLAALAALEGVTADDLPDHMSRLGERLRMAINADPERAANKLEEAKGRYRFVG